MRKRNASCQFIWNHLWPIIYNFDFQFICFKNIKIKHIFKGYKNFFFCNSKRTLWRNKLNVCYFFFKNIINIWSLFNYFFITYVNRNFWINCIKWAFYFLLNLKCFNGVFRYAYDNEATFFFNCNRLKKLNSWRDWYQFQW